MLDFQAVGDEGTRDWYSIGVVRRLITGERRESEVLNEEWAHFLCDQIDEIERRFSPAELSETKARLKELERIRAKELFG